MADFKVLALGEVLFDVINGENKLGGAPFNVAAHMAKLGNESYILSAVGNDDLGNQIIQEADQLGVRTNFIHMHDKKSTGTVKVDFKDGEPEYEIIQNVAWDYLKADLAKVNDTEWTVVAFGSLAQRSDHNQAFYKRLFKKLEAKWLYFDCNLRQKYFTRSILEESLHFANIGKFNEHEIEVVSNLLYDQKLTPERFASKLCDDYSIDLVVYTWGKEGARAWYEGEYYSAPSLKVTTKDTVGAGDAFSAGFLHSWIHGSPIKQALRHGNKLGGYVASRSGAIPDYNDDIKTYFDL